MVRLLLLKQLANLSDERVVEEWRKNPYFQAFCGMKTFQWQLPCEPSDFCHFRKRIGEKGMEKIFQISVEIHGNQALESEIVVDTTVQEKKCHFSHGHQTQGQGHSQMLEDRQKGKACPQAQLSQGSEEASAHHPLQPQ